MHSKIISLLLLAVMLLTLLLTSCGTDSDGNQDGIDAGGIGSGGSGNSDEKPEIKNEYTALKLKLGSFEISDDGEGSLYIKDALIYFELTEDGEIIAEGSGTVIEGFEGAAHTDKSAEISEGEPYGSGDESGAAFEDGAGAECPFELAVFGAKAYIYFKDEPDEPLRIYDSEELLSAIEEAYGVDISLALENLGGEQSVFEEWLNRELVPALGDINASVVISKIAELRVQLLDQLITEDLDAAGKKIYSVSFDKISELYKLVSENSVKAAVESLFGEGGFRHFKELVTAVLPYSLDELLLTLEENGASREGVLSAIESLLRIVFADDSITLEGLLKLDGDLLELSYDKTFTVKKLLMNFIGLTTDKELTDFLFNFYDELSKKTLIEYLGDLFGDKDRVSRIFSLIGEISEGTEVSYTKNKMGEIDTFTLSGSFGEDGNLSLIVGEITAKYLEGEVQILIDSDKDSEGIADIEIATEKRASSIKDGEIFARLENMKR